MPKTSIKKPTLRSTESESIIDVLRERFEANMARHKGMKWADVAARLDAKKLHSLGEMEATGGEPDVIGQDKKTSKYLFCDCSEESPKGRRSTCFDREARTTRKEHPPKESAVEMAEAMGIELLSEDEYRALQKLGEFDTKTSSWVQSPIEIRELGGALFCDRRYNEVFVYHNGAQSYYAARGFRGMLRV